MDINDWHGQSQQNLHNYPTHLVVCQICCPLCTLPSIHELPLAERNALHARLELDAGRLARLADLAELARVLGLAPALVTRAVAVAGAEAVGAGRGVAIGRGDAAVAVLPCVWRVADAGGALAGAVVVAEGVLSEVVLAAAVVT